LPPAAAALVDAARGRWGRLGDRRPLLALVALGALLLLAAAPLVSLPYGNEYKLVRLAALPLGLLAGAGLGDAWRRGGTARALGATWAAVLAAGALADLGLTARAYLDLAAVDAPLEEDAGVLLPAPGGSAAADERRAAYAFLRSDERVRAVAPALLVDAFHLAPVDHGPPPGRPLRETTFNLQGHPAAAFSALDLVADRPSQANPKTRRLARRVELAARALGPDPEAGRRALAELVTERRPGVALLALVGPLERAHRVLRRFGATALFAWPAGFATLSPSGAADGPGRPR